MSKGNRQAAETADVLLALKQTTMLWRGAYQQTAPEQQELNSAQYQ